MVRGLVPAGIVDGRDIRELVAADLLGHAHAHFFAGIGGWAEALRLAGWPLDVPVWTGSCPCQPFSSAGSRKGFADERHLWPEWFRLVDECRPPVVFGEQVASRDGLAWLDTVSSDLEGIGYAVGAADLCAASVGAPHRRQRLWFVGVAGGLADDYKNRLREFRSVHNHYGALAHGDDAARRGADGSAPVALGDASSDGDREHDRELPRDEAEHAHRRTHSSDAPLDSSSACRGFWREPEWLAFRDGTLRPVEPGTFPLAHGFPERMVQLSGYGNAIVPQVAAAFIRSAVDAILDGG